MNEEQIAKMVNRFLQWRLPENFNPDGGISFKQFHEGVGEYKREYKPIGTNLFTYTQAEEMVRYMLEGIEPPHE